MAAEVDAMRLEQVLQDLIDNAVQLNPDRARIDVGVALIELEQAQIEVADQACVGPGSPTLVVRA